MNTIKTFYKKSLNTLELPAVLSMLASEAVSETAKENCLELLPSGNADEVRHRLEETDSAVKMMELRGSPSFGGIKDVRGSLERARLGGSLSMRELLEIAGVLRTARTVRAYIADDACGKTPIDCLFNALHANRYLEDRINTSIVTDDEMSDAASSDLADIRRKMRAAAARARDALQKIISSPTYARALQENIVTMRSDRYVVPVKAEFKNQVPGLVHDVSATGSTVFVEPMAAVKANNELRELAAKEKAEIEKILAEMSAECAEHADDISSDYTLLTKLDLIFAKAKLSYRLNCVPVTSDNGPLVLNKARHPLLDRDTAVPIDLELGGDFDTIVITGPNTGGKTVTLKTIGLLSAMNQCGLHVPCADGSNLPVFSSILADIGDEQSIEQSLSTFSSHMKNIVAITDEADERSLVLFDELGAGTDPTEGAALAVSIIENIRKKGALVAATTHYTELKMYATNEKGVLNASCEFDVDTLRPTYRLLLGIPGKSNAFAISSRLGLDSGIIEDAKSRVATESASFEATIEKLELTRKALEDRLAEADRKVRTAEENERKSAQLRRELEVRLEKADQKARREAEDILSEARETAERVFEELDEMRRHINDEENARATNEARAELRRQLNLAEEKTVPAKVADTRKSARAVKTGDMVEIKSMGVKGEVISVSPDRNLSVKAGIMTVNVKEDDVYLLANEKKPEVKIRGGSVPSAHLSCPRELDIRGMETLEGTAVAEQYIDNAVMAHLDTVTIIHGKGTGALREAIHRMLRKNKSVRKFRIGSFGEGESGVTIVELKK